MVASESEKDGSGREARLYADERKEYLAFKATDDRLVTRIAAAEVIRDMVNVAPHRRWEALHVRGSVAFRRETWLGASARGMDVKAINQASLTATRSLTDETHGTAPRPGPAMQRLVPPPPGHRRPIDSITTRTFPDV